jgi:4-oxalocrotonate tautomerase
MPFIVVRIQEGRPPEKIETLIAALTDATHQALGAPKDSVRVIVEEVPKTHWGIGGQSAKALGR